MKLKSPLDEIERRIVAMEEQVQVEAVRSWSAPEHVVEAMAIENQFGALMAKYQRGRNSHELGRALLAKARTDPDPNIRAMAERMTRNRSA